MKMQFLDILNSIILGVSAWNAYAARCSAKAAMEATRLAEESLLEMRKTYFKDGYNILFEKHNNILKEVGNDSNLLIVFYVQIMPDDFVMLLHRF
ncbi:hypothetical protein JOW43_24120 [Escherichia coli]|nr:hypothetical protein [Escherichia coli]MBZ1482558.1 hypothetical protein [Escherichia coli]